MKSLYQWMELKKGFIVQAWFDRIYKETSMRFDADQITGIRSELIYEKAKDTSYAYGVNHTLLSELTKNFEFFLNNLTCIRKIYQFGLVMKIKILSQSGKEKLLNLAEFLHEEIHLSINDDKFHITEQEKENLKNEISMMSKGCAEALDSAEKTLNRVRENEIRRGVLNSIPPEYSCPSGFDSEQSTK